MNAESEVWVGIYDLPKYMISSHGNVRHVSRPGLLQAHVNHRGFLTVVLYRDTEVGPVRTTKQVNRLVADVFLAPPKHRDQTAVWHIDGDLTNCHKDNLRWERRDRVLAWNDMHRTGVPKYKTPKVYDRVTGMTYKNAYDCGMATGELEASVIKKVESFMGPYEEKGRYSYVD